jgi:ferrous iron transport protein A
MDEVAIRLLEMGLTPSVEFELLGIAPLGDPIEIEVRGYRLSLRKSEAARVSVEFSR